MDEKKSKQPVLDIIKSNLPELYKYAIWFLSENLLLKDQEKDLFSQHLLLSDGSKITITPTTLLEILLKSMENIMNDDKNALKITEEIFKGANKIRIRNKELIMNPHLPGTSSSLIH